MANRVTLSCWVSGYTAENMLVNFEKALWRFPFSRLAGLAQLTIYAVDYSEAPVEEEVFGADSDAADIIEACREFAHPDCAFELEAAWDLWQLVDGEMQLRPSRVLITCFAPEFPSDIGENLRVDLGPEDLYLPPEDDDGMWLRAIQSNIRSVLHLAEDWGETLKLDRRLLWSEEGDNLAERLHAALASYDG